MSSKELTLWQAHDALTAIEQKRAQEMADKGMTPTPFPSF